MDGFPEHSLEVFLTEPLDNFVKVTIEELLEKSMVDFRTEPKGTRKGFLFSKIWRIFWKIFLEEFMKQSIENFLKESIKEFVQKNPMIFFIELLNSSFRIHGRLSEGNGQTS